MNDYFVCPNCGADVPQKALACPECGSDEETGWSEDTLYDGIEFPEYETSDTQPSTSLFHNKYILYIVAIITIAAFIWIYVL